MPDRSGQSRAGRSRREGRQRAREIARRLGADERELRRSMRLSQASVGVEAGVSQPWLSSFERGGEPGVGLATVASVAAAVGQRLVVFFEQAPGADRPRDVEHLRRQQLVLRVASLGGWQVLPEEPVDLYAVRSRSIDVLLTRRASSEAAVVEVWDWFTDVGEAMRSLDAKVSSLERHLGGGRDVRTEPWIVAGLWVVRRTRRNVALVREFGDLLGAKFPARPAAWLGALSEPATRMPTAHGLLWSDATASRLMVPRLMVRNPGGREARSRGTESVRGRRPGLPRAL